MAALEQHGIAHDRPPRRQPLSVRGHRREARLHARRRDREHRHRRPGDGALGGEELEGRRGGDRRVAVRRRARRAAARRQAVSDETQLRARGGRVQPHQQLRRRDQRLPVVADEAGGARSEFPAQTNGRFVKLQDLRYGENPHQAAAFYRDLQPAPGSLVTGQAAAGQGALVQQHRRRRCGVGMREELRHAGLRDRQACQPVRRGARRPMRPRPTARRSRPTRPRPSAASSPSTASSTPRRAALVAKQFVEVLIAPGFTREALAVFAAKPNARLLQIALPPGGPTRSRGPQRARREARRLGPADPDRRQPRRCSASELKVVTTKRPTPEQLDDLLFAWKVAKYVKSNAIVFCGGGMTLGVGAGPDEPHRLGAHRAHQGAERRAVARRARRWRATRSSRFATGSTWWSMPAPAA